MRKRATDMEREMATTTIKAYGASEVGSPTVSDEGVTFTLSSGFEASPFDQTDEVVRSIDLLGRARDPETAKRDEHPDKT